MAKVIFVGAGNIAQSHYQALSLAGADVVGVCTRGESGRQFAEVNNIPNYDADLTALIERTQPDAAMLLTQPESYQTLLKTIQPFNLPVFLEKPVGYTVDDALALQPYLPERTFVGLNRRFYGNIQAILPLLQDEPGFMAQLILPERLKDFMHRDEKTVNHWPMLNSIHGVDLITYLAGIPVRLHTVRQWSPISGTALYQYNTATYETEPGNTVVFMSNFDSPGGWRIHLFLKGREVMISPFEKTAIKSLSGLEEIPTAEDDTLAKPGFLRQARTFLQGVENPSEPLPAHWVSFEEAVASMRVVEQVFQTKVNVFSP